MIKALNITDLIDSSVPGMLKVRLYTFLSRKYEYTKTDLEVIIEDSVKVFKDDAVIALIKEWVTVKEN